MALQDNTGQIHKGAFLVSISFFLGLALIGVIVRFAIRFRSQKQWFQIDDGLLILATILLLAALIIMYSKVIDSMYLMAGIQDEIKGVETPTNVVEISEDFHKWITASLILSWCSISAVKFFFIALFWRLTDRLRAWKIYWWIVFVVNVVAIIFGATVYYVSCPYWGAQAMYCSSGRYMNRLVRYSAAQITLDIIGDLMILAIPTGLLWKVRINLTQKLAFMSSLCLTIFLVALSITRCAGLIYRGTVDDVWEVFWITMSANLGVFLAAASAFRSFFASQK
ncbi:hypothetical protein N7495_010031 [Penicillium taxi]|uniref:uncharacterized protein n=1 Tax=Penicillium taxi TaxID=168475 RepID=UPI002544F11E|nr:uncharacterized protein N7495_010031 [Penicillium taxi]KAJ5885521.1 hypothetical protein N7495_010031 [Penicillium taxi]